MLHMGEFVLQDSNVLQDRSGQSHVSQAPTTMSLAKQSVKIVQKVFIALATLRLHLFVLLAITAPRTLSQSLQMLAKQGILTTSLEELTLVTANLAPQVITVTDQVQLR